METPLSQFLMQFDWLIWGVVLIVGLPALVVALGELAQKLPGWGLGQWRKLVDLVRNSCLFLLFSMVLLRMVVGLPGDHMAVKLVDTVFWTTVLNAALVLFNTIVFETGASAWRAKAPKLLTDLGRIFVVSVGAAFIVSHVWGVDLNGLLAALGVGSIVIGLALQDTLSNLFAGVMMVTVRPFNIGDWIKVGDTDGQVRSISWRTVTVATQNGDIVDIPNSQIYRERMTVFGADTGRLRILTEVRFSNDYAPERVIGLLQDAAERTEGVLAEPRPQAIVKAMEDFAIVYVVSFWIDDFRHSLPARGEYLANLWYLAGRREIALMGQQQPAMPSAASSPAMSSPAASPKTPAAALSVVPNGAVQASSMDAHPAPSASGASVVFGIAEQLHGLATFQRPLEALRPLAVGARFERHRRGEVILRPGVRGDACFIVVAGTAQAMTTIDGHDVQVFAYGRGDLILFKSFFRGGDAPYTVRAVTDLEVVMAPISTLENALARDLHLAQQVEQLLSQREDAETAGDHRTSGKVVGGDRVDILKNLFRT